MSSATESAGPGLVFEQPIYELEVRIRDLEQSTAKSTAVEDDLRALRRELADVTRQIYGNLSPWEMVQVARHKNRPYSLDYLNLAFEEFVELHGDRRFGDDRAILTGFAKLDQFKVMVIGHQKGRTYKERSACYFGCAHPEGYRKALLKMQMAAKYRLPVVCFIDTPGAYPGVGAEERGQSQAIAENMYEMSRLETPVICVVIGEGGRRRAGDWRRRSRGYSRTRLLLGHQSRRLCRYLVEERHPCRESCQGAALHIQRPAAVRHRRYSA
jgi:acetyl-CoA carboxylase carboxyl transferase subunit alpha